MPSKNRPRRGSSAGNGTGRVYKEEGTWYFTTREQTVEGPFQSAAQAESHLKDYVMMMCSGLSPLDGSDVMAR